jgi:hypothetical protein
VGNTNSARTRARRSALGFPRPLKSVLHPSICSVLLYRRQEKHGERTAAPRGWNQAGGGAGFGERNRARTRSRCRSAGGDLSALCLARIRIMPLHAGLTGRAQKMPPAKSSSSCSALSRDTTVRYRFPDGCCGWLATDALTLCGAGTAGSGRLWKLKTEPRSSRRPVRSRRRWAPRTFSSGIFCDSVIFIFFVGLFPEEITPRPLEAEILPRPINQPTLTPIMPPEPPEPRIDPIMPKGSKQQNGVTEADRLLGAIVLVARREPPNRGALRFLIRKFSNECGLGF